MKPTALHVAVLFTIGMGWSITLPLTKIAVSTGHQHFGLMVWQLAIGFCALTLVGLLRKRPLPRHPAALKTYVIIAFVGTILPNSLSYQAAAHLPAGVMSILISMIPIWAFPIALILANERYESRRLIGLCLGFAATLILILPSTQLDGALPVTWLLLTLVVALCYGFEGNFVAKWGTGGCDPLETLWGATFVGLIIIVPAALVSKQWIPPNIALGPPEMAQIVLSGLSIMAYCGYVWLVTKAGPVFSVQVSYIVTIFGVFWSAVLLGERYPGFVWLSLVLMLAGMALVQPRRRTVEPAPTIPESGAK